MATISVVIPCYNAACTLGRCLEALARERDSGAPIGEIIVVDDASTDDSADVARRYDARLLQLPRNSGDCAARNAGARQATGELLWFLDADVEPHAGSAGPIDEYFQKHPDVDALIGSYDDHPSAPGLCSQFKNLMHHFVHQQNRRDVSTFWTGCGAIRREIFERLGGFDDSFWPGSSITDMELGYRLGRHGQKIHFMKQLQVRHHKRWGLIGLVRTDVMQRAIPWTQLMLRYPDLVRRELNLGWTYRISIMAVWLALIALPAGIVWRPAWAIAIIGLVITLAAHRRLLGFFRRRHGLGFMLRTIPLAWLYCFYSGLGYLAGRACHALRLRPRRR